MNRLVFLFLKNKFLVYILEIAIAAYLLFLIDSGFFLLFFFVVVIIHIDCFANETNRMIMSDSLENGLWRDVIRRKMGITDAEYEELRQYEIDRMRPDYRAAFNEIEKFVDRR